MGIALSNPNAACQATCYNAPNCLKPTADQMAAISRRGIMVNPKTKEIKRTKVRGKVAIVTGCTSGLGKYVCKILCKAGMHVIMTGRSRTRLKNAEKEVRSATQRDANITVGKIDVASLTSIREFVDSFIDLHLPVHLLVNCAGIMASPYAVSMDGLEKQLETNYVGHFFLTLLLLPKLRASGSARIVNVSSSLHHFCENEFDVNKLNPCREEYDRFMQYSKTKACMILHARKLARELKEDNISCFSVHPGFAPTTISKRFLPAETFYTTACCCIKSVPAAAATIIYCCLYPDIEKYTGGYFANLELTMPARFVIDVELEDALWKRTEKFCTRALAMLEKHLPSNKNDDEDKLSELELGIVKYAQSCKKLLDKIQIVNNTKLITSSDEVVEEEEEKEEKTDHAVGIRFEEDLPATTTKTISLEPKYEVETMKPEDLQKLNEKKKEDKAKCNDALAEALRLASVQEF